MSLKLMYLIKSRLKNKKEKVKKEIFLHKSPSKICFGNGIHSLLKQADELAKAS